MIRQVKKEEIPELVNLHLITLPNSVEVKLGENFLRLFYESLLYEPGFFCDGFFLDSRMVAFLIYSPDPWKIFRSVLKRKFGVFSWIVFKSVLHRPNNLILLLRMTPLLFGWASEPGYEVKGEGIHIAILEDYRRLSRFYDQTRINIGRELLQNMMIVLSKLGVKRIKSLPNIKDKATISYLRRANWHCVGQVVRWGESLQVYVKDLDQTKEVMSDS